MGCFALSAQVFGQTNIFFDFFDDDAKWTLNQGNGVTGLNEFVINSSYDGNVPNNIQNTPDQPADILGSPQGGYMHILSSPDCTGSVSCNAHYDPTSESNTFAEMAYDVSTIGATGVSVSFWYLCKGETGDAYGNLEYSIDGGQNWLSIGPDLVDTANWGQLIITDPVFDNQENLRFAFHWRNSAVGTGGDQALAIDQFQIDAANAPNVISPQHTSNLAFCPGTPFNIGFLPLGLYSTGNTYTVMLSDENGSFLAQQAIGSLTTPVSNNNMQASVIFPQSLAMGNNYRIRVISTVPVSTPITSDPFTIHASPTVGILSDPDPAMICNGESVQLVAQGSSDVTEYEWTPAQGLNATTNDTVVASPTTSATYTITVTNSDHCSSTLDIGITVDPCMGIGEHVAVDITLYPNPASDVVHITAAAIVSKAELLDQSGRVIRTMEVNNTELDLNISDLNQGVYFIRISHAGGNSTARFSKR